jgi:hypothetical protein
VSGLADETTYPDRAAVFGFNELAMFSMLYANMFGETPSATLCLEPAQSARECGLPQCVAANPPPVLGGHADRNPEPL